MFFALPALVLTTLSWGAAPAESPHVAQFVVVEVKSRAKFVELMNRAAAIAAKYQSTGKLRSWGYAYAGTEVGRIIVMIEYPSMESLAQSGDKLHKTAEFQQWIADADAAGIKKVSESIIVEMR